MNYINILIVEDYTKYIGKKAILIDSIDGLLSVIIIGGSRVNAKIQHMDGGLLKV